MPVQIGSHVEMCSECGALKVCGEFWSIEPRCRWFWCLECLERMAAGVRSAMARGLEPTVRRL